MAFLQREEVDSGPAGNVVELVPGGQREPGVGGGLLAGQRPQCSVTVAPSPDVCLPQDATQHPLPGGRPSQKRGLMGPVMGASWPPPPLSVRELAARKRPCSQ